MRREERDPALLMDMLQAAKRVVLFCQSKSMADYAGDLLLQSAVERQLEILGEAARLVSDSFKTTHPEIQWRGIIAQRHVLAHEYGRIEHDRIWRIVTVHIPELIEKLQPLLPEPPNETTF